MALRRLTPPPVYPPKADQPTTTEGDRPSGPKTGGGVRFPAAVAGLLVGFLLFAPPAQEDIIRGLQKIVSGVFQLPLSTLAGTFSGPPIVGTVVGALSGAFNGVGLVASGVLDLAASAVPIVKTVAPFLIPIFL